MPDASDKLGWNRATKAPQCQKGIGAFSLHEEREDTNMIITFPDGSKREYENGLSALDIAASLSQ
ncbi:MAG: hypothetical protein IKT99_00445, partial [Oscillospiraceae bacterium]|nr:hypothetical protein [Oscillospiraceae bacterium]